MQIAERLHASMGAIEMTSAIRSKWREFVAAANRIAEAMNMDPIDDISRRVTRLEERLKRVEEEPKSPSDAIMTQATADADAPVCNKTVERRYTY